jgi:hypothetical protein
VTRERFTISTGIYRSLRKRSETWRFSDVHKPASDPTVTRLKRRSRAVLERRLLRLRATLSFTAKLAYVPSRKSGVLAGKFTAEVCQQAQMLLSS